MPVYNGAELLAEALDSILAQDFTDFEVIVSDNASTDATDEIALAYAARDTRVRYVRQPENLGALPNFAFVLDQAVGEFFLWAAVDDTRSTDYLRTNYNFLVNHPDYVGSTSPTGYDEPLEHPRIDGGSVLTGTDPGTRIIAFLKVTHDNSCFYALFRRAPLQAAMSPIAWYMGFDWSIMLRVTARGPIALLDRGFCTRGSRGISTDQEYMIRSNRVRWINWILPFFDFSFVALRCARLASWRKRGTIAYLLLRLNYRAFRAQIAHTLARRRRPVAVASTCA